MKKKKMNKWYTENFTILHSRLYVNSYGMFVSKANKWMWSGAKAQICPSSCSSGRTSSSATRLTSRILSANRSMLKTQA